MPADLYHRSISHRSIPRFCLESAQRFGAAPAMIDGDADWELCRGFMPGALRGGIGVHVAGTVDAIGCVLSDVAVGISGSARRTSPHSRSGRRGARYGGPYGMPGDLDLDWSRYGQGRQAGR